MKKLLLCALALTTAFALFATTLASAPSAHAAPSTIGGPKVGCGCNPGYYFIKNIVNGGLEYDPEIDFVLGPGTGVSINKTWGVSTSWQANAGISGDTVSAGLNFTVGISWSTSETCTAPTNTTGHDQTLQWQTVYIDWYYDVYWHNDTYNSNVYQGSGWAKEFDYDRCALY